MQRVLVVEDEDGLRRSIVRYLKRSGVSVASAGSRADAKEAAQSFRPDLLITDVALPDGFGFDVIDDVRRHVPDARVIVMTGHVMIDHAVTALRRGADDFLTKPFSLDALGACLERVQGSLNLCTLGPTAPDELEAWREEFCPGLIGEDPTLLRVLDIVRRVADTDCSVLVTGDTGTGKELIAEAIHRASGRRGGAFVPVNCAAIPENLMESELFGHAKGAFTGATSAHQGRFAVADGGTLLLDEIGEMAASLQAKLLRVLQEGEIRPIGENKVQAVDVRVVAATHRDVDDMAMSGDFREDLLYRLDVIRIELPSLRQRRSDVPRLAKHFLEDCAARRRRNVTSFDEVAMDALVHFDWPGNVRQLRHVIERMVVLATGSTLTLADVPPKILAQQPSRKTGSGAPILPESGLHLKDAVEEFENALILQALERTGWNKNQAAAILHMNRTTLVEKIKKKGIEPALAS